MNPPKSFFSPKCTFLRPSLTFFFSLTQEEKEGWFFFKFAPQNFPTYCFKKDLMFSHNLGSMKMNVFTSGIDLIDIQFHLGCPLVQLPKLNPHHKIENTATYCWLADFGSVPKGFWKSFRPSPKYISWMIFNAMMLYKLWYSAYLNRYSYIPPNNIRLM